jgi:hypothetical protein
MKQNMALADRIIRIVLVAAVVVLYFTHQLPLIAAVILGAVALVFLVTGIVGTCPLYRLLGISTRRKTAA